MRYVSGYTRTITGSGELRVEIEEFPWEIVYSIHEGNLRRTRYTINKYHPGWKQVWDQVLPILVELVNDEQMRGGAGLQSRAFQRSPIPV